MLDRLFKRATPLEISVPQNASPAVRSLAMDLKIPIGPAVTSLSQVDLPSGLSFALPLIQAMHRDNSKASISVRSGSRNETEVIGSRLFGQPVEVYSPEGELVHRVARGGRIKLNETTSASQGVLRAIGQVGDSIVRMVLPYRTEEVRMNNAYTSGLLGLGSFEDCQRGVKGKRASVHMSGSTTREGYNGYMDVTQLSLVPQLTDQAPQDSDFESLLPAHTGMEVRVHRASAHISGATETSNVRVSAQASIFGGSAEFDVPGRGHVSVGAGGEYTRQVDQHGNVRDIVMPNGAARLLAILTNNYPSEG